MVSATLAGLYLTWIHLLAQTTANKPYDMYAYSELGHKYVTTATEVPYHVLVVYENLYCSGTLVRSKIVVTTAGCITAGVRDKSYVKVGASSITGLGQVIPVVEVKIHEYFGYYSKMDNDIAMLVLKESVVFGETVKKVILIDPDTDLEPGTLITVTGWASQNIPQKHANLLLRTDMPIMERQECIAAYRRLITPSNYCAKYMSNRRIDDIGGPATHKDQLVGIMSFGDLETYDPDIAVFTNITYFHRWISINSKRFMEKYCTPQKESYKNYTHLSSAEVLINRVHIV